MSVTAFRGFWIICDLNNFRKLENGIREFLKEKNYENGTCNYTNSMP